MADLDISAIKFMIVEDNPFMRNILKLLLRSYNVRDMKEANDGSQAFKELQGYKPDIILVDWEMQPLDGLDFARLVRTGEDSPDRFVPMIMVSGYSETTRIFEARDAGINEYLVKPISAQTLFSRIRAVIERPRPFIEIDSYFGPDRRRRQDENYRGEERRGTGVAAPSDDGNENEIVVESADEET